MFEAILSAIRSLGPFSANDEEVFCAALQTKALKKGDSILEKGEVCKALCFVQKGSFIQYFMDENLDKVIANLFNQHDWAINRASFTGQKPSMHTIEAFEESTLQVLNIHDLHALIGRSPSFFVLGKILEEIHDYQSQKLSPDQKYKLLLEKRPEVIQTFPLKYISSYLGMTPETLSRVRSRIS